MLILIASAMILINGCLKRYYESYVTGMYLATKVFYVGNVLSNLLLVNKFLETNEYSIYGFGVLRDLLFGKSWMESGNFPRVTLVGGLYGTVTRVDYYRVSHR